MSKLKLEVFESNKEISPLSFFVYRIVPQEQTSNVQQLMRSAAGKISYRQKQVAFTDDRKIYTLDELRDINIDKTFQLEFEGREELQISENRRIYQDVIDYFIRNNLQKIKVQEKYAKYRIADTVSSPWIYELRQVLSSSYKDYRLRRDYNYTIKISEKNRAQIWINISSEFESKKTVFDLVKNKNNVIGLKVSNSWGKFGEKGTVQSVGPETVVDELPNFKPLKQYMVDTKQDFRIRDCRDDTPVVHVKMSNGKEICYYPQALIPVVTLEQIANADSQFSKEIEKYTKLDMKTRQLIAKDFISDIGKIESLDNISFNLEYADPAYIGFTEKSFIAPRIICGNNRKIDCNKISFVFRNGFYRQPKEQVKFAYFYPKGKKELMQSFAISLTDFLQKGSLFGDKNYLVSGLMNSELKAAYNEEYEEGDITGYKKLVRGIPDEISFDVAIVLVQKQDEDESNPYGTFKTAWAEKNIPSQMISVETAEMFSNKDKNAVWRMHNIALGVFAKAGGIPWIVEDVPGDIDCFVGIDVATIEKGIHYPTCATVFDRNGRPVSFYKPKKAQRGEKISRDVLQEIFDEVILGYEESTGSKIKNLVIHRDGFSNEDAKWYKEYFSEKGIKYSVIEVKKFVSCKMLSDENGVARNPKFGDAIVSESEAYIITTDINDGRSSPRPLHIKKQTGDLNMDIILKQILALSCMNFGATKKSRLPVTTFYADKICKNIDYVPEGKFGNRLFFL